MADDGALTFARFAYPPNELGYCGPDRRAELLERIDAGAGGRGLRAIAAAFEGAWPYLCLIASENGIPDPLDRRVVEAYWIGGALLDRVPARSLAACLLHPGQARPAPVGTARDRLLQPLLLGAVPHHNFHVFGVYPWVGLLRSGLVDQPLRVLDRCRVRWGRVDAVEGDHVTVRYRPLRWDGRRLLLGPPEHEVVLRGRDGYRVARDLRPGDWYALHWQWLCTRLDADRLAALRHCTRRQLDAVNRVPFPAPASVLS